MRWQRSCACRSACGFQSLSKMMHVSADTRLMPRPPARVESRKTSMVGSVLKSFIACMRSAAETPPSSLLNFHVLHVR